MTDFYVDLSAGSAGAGTFASPWNRFTLIAGVTGGVDKVWARRVTFVDTSIHINWTPPSGVPIIGWPISGDEDYATRPAAAQAAWDGDAGTYATVTMTDASQSTTGDRTVVYLGAGSYTLKRISITYTVTSAVNTSYNHAAIILSAVPALLSLYRCAIRVLPSGTFVLSALPLGTVVCSVAVAGSVPCALRECTLELGVNVLNGAVLAFPATGSNFSLSPGVSDCTLLLSGQASRAFWTGMGSSVYGGNGNFVRCAFINTAARTVTGSFLSTPTSVVDASTTNIPSFVDCSFSTVASSTPGYANLTLIAERLIRCMATGFSSLVVNQRARAHFSSWLQGGIDTSAAGAVAVYESGPIAVFDSLVLVAGNTKDIYLHPGRHSSVIARQITEGTGGYSAPYADGRILLANINNITGTWKYILPEGTSETSANARVGGEAFSVLMKPAAGGGVAPLSAATVGLRSALPGEDTVFVSLAAGARTVTVFGYYGGYTTIPSKATVWLDVEYPTSSGFTVATTKATGVVTADASTWSGFSGGTAFKMVASFTPPADCVGAIRITTTAFDTSTAYIAIDPKPVVV